MPPLTDATIKSHSYRFRELPSRSHAPHLRPLRRCHQNWKQCNRISLSGASATASAAPALLLCCSKHVRKLPVIIVFNFIRRNHCARDTRCAYSHVVAKVAAREEKKKQILFFSSARKPIVLSFWAETAKRREIEEIVWQWIWPPLLSRNLIRKTYLELIHIKIVQLTLAHSSSSHATPPPLPPPPHRLHVRGANLPSPLTGMSSPAMRPRRQRSHFIYAKQRQWRKSKNSTCTLCADETILNEMFYYIAFYCALLHENVSGDCIVCAIQCGKFHCSPLN